MHSFARSVTRPRSPGPAPTRKHLPVLVFTAVHPTIQSCRDPFWFLCAQGRSHLSGLRGCVPLPENLRAKGHFVVLDCSQNAHRRLTITLQASQQVTFCPQT